MTMLKSFVGHTSCEGIFKYLNYERGTGRARALALDTRMVLDPARWWREFDETRELFGKYMQKTMRGKPREYYHFIVSPDAADEADLETVRELAQSWVDRNFYGYQAAIVYHDDNAERLSKGKEGIVHAHVVVNSVHPETGLKIQLSDDDNDRLADDLQDIATELGLTAFDNDGRDYKRRNRGMREEVVFEKSEERIAARGDRSFKRELREIVDGIVRTSESFEELKRRLAPYGYGVVRTRKTLLFITPDGKRVTARALGLSYTESGLGKKYLAVSFMRVNRVRYRTFSSRYAHTSRNVARANAQMRDLQAGFDALAVIYREDIKSYDEFQRKIDELREFGRDERTALYKANKDIERRNATMASLRTVLAVQAGEQVDDSVRDRAFADLEAAGIDPADASTALVEYERAGIDFSDAKAVVDGTARRIQDLLNAQYVAGKILQTANEMEASERRARGLPETIPAVKVDATKKPPRAYKNARTAPYWKLQIKKEKYAEIVRNDRAWRANAMVLENASAMRPVPNRSQQILASQRAERLREAQRAHRSDER